MAVKLKWLKLSAWQWVAADPVHRGWLYRVRLDCGVYWPRLLGTYGHTEALGQESTLTAAKARCHNFAAAHVNSSSARLGGVP